MEPRFASGIWRTPEGDLFTPPEGIGDEDTWYDRKNKPKRIEISCRAILLCMQTVLNSIKSVVASTTQQEEDMGELMSTGSAQEREAEDLLLKYLCKS